MKTRNLILLIVIAVVLIGWATWIMRPQPERDIALIGSPVLPGLPVNRVAKIVLTAPNDTVTLAKVNGIWAVASRFNYPAAFDKIADSLLQLSELKIGQVIAASQTQKGAFALLDPVQTAERKEQVGTRVELRDEKDGLLGTMLIGKPFMRAAPGGGMAGPLAFGGDYPDGQYIETADGRVLLVAKTLDRLTGDVKNWLASEFINVGAADIQAITVSGPDRAPITLTRSKEGDTFALEGLKTEEGTLDSTKVNQMSGALNYLGFDDLAAPTLPPNVTGMDRPVVFEAKTKQGQIYTLRIGNTLTNDTFDRYVQVVVAWKAPAEDKKETAKPETGTNTVDAVKASQQKADETKALNDRLATWTYILKSYRVEPLLIKRVELIKKAEPPKEAEKSAQADKPTQADKSTTADKPAKVDKPAPAIAPVKPAGPIKPAPPK